MKKRSIAIGAILAFSVIAWLGLAQHTISRPDQTQRQAARVFSIAQASTEAGYPATLIGDGEYD